MDPQEIAAVRDLFEPGDESPALQVVLRNTGEIMIGATMDEAEAALIDADVIADPTEDDGVPELTEDEVKALTALLDEDYEWLARDGDGKLFAYASKPKKVGVFWETDADKLQPRRVKEPMEFIDAEPWSIPYLLLDA